MTNKRRGTRVQIETHEIKIIRLNRDGKLISSIQELTADRNLETDTDERPDRPIKTKQGEKYENK